MTIHANVSLDAAAMHTFTRLLKYTAIHVVITDDTLLPPDCSTVVLD